jgi:S-layer family protein
MTKRSLALAALLMGRTLHAQTPAGPELLVNTHTGRPFDVSVALDKGGRFVVAWTRDASAALPVARGFTSTGAALGDEFTVGPVNSLFFQSLVSDRKGGFLAMGGKTVTRFDASGRSLSGPVQIGADTIEARIAPTPDGGFIVARLVAAPQGHLILGRRYDSAGNAVGSEFQVNTTTGGFEAYQAIAGTPSGQFVVAWQSFDEEDYGIRAQRITGAGDRLGSEFLVNTTELGYQAVAGGSFDHVVAAARDGSFVVTWASYDHTRARSDLMARRYDPQGVPRGDEFRVNTSTTAFAIGSRVAMDDSGDFVIAWSELTGPTHRLRARRFDAEGDTRGNEFQVNTSTTESPGLASVDSDPAGNFVVAWITNGPNGPSNVRAQRFGGLLPAALAVDAAGNGVLEPGETGVMAPTWRNLNGQAQTFTGTLARLSGPAGGTYTIEDGAAGYGTVPDGAAGGCGGDCFAINVSGTRPALHWDATATERLAPDSQGQVQAWAVHLGDSFTDVPRTSAFYRFVETLLHRGITGGCGASAYCPGSTTTREQMAVFALVAREGAGYVPPACTTPRFGDVPASSPYCRWVEELARRGVAAGCGGGNYCPHDAVARDQMAVFLGATFGLTLYGP